jgi:phosphatidylinositol alpha-1,6-mannosyltransferase
VHIGIMAPEFPPEVGGMCSYAVGIATELARSDRVTVYTLEGRGDPALALEQKPTLTRDLRTTRRSLQRETVDVWYTLNAGLAALAPRLDAPLATMFNGNDFVNPWLVYRRWWLEPFTTGRWRRAARDLRRALSRRDLDRALRETRGVFAISSASANLAATIYPQHHHKMKIVPPGVDDFYFHASLPESADKHARHPIRILTVARLEAWTRRKNVDGVMRALPLLPADVPVTYTIVGDGDDRARLEQLAAELNVADRVRFTGRISRAVLLDVYRESDLFVLAAQARPNDIEGFGIVYLEAAAMGVPALCSRAGGATDAVEDGVTGLVLDSSSPQAIADGIVKFAHLRTTFDPRQVRAFAEKFRWSQIAATIRRELREIAAQPAAVPARAEAAPAGPR